MQSPTNNNYSATVTGKEDASYSRVIINGWAMAYLAHPAKLASFRKLSLCIIGAAGFSVTYVINNSVNMQTINTRKHYVWNCGNVELAIATNMF